MKLTFTAQEIKSIVGIYVRAKFGENTAILRTFMSEDGATFGMDVEVPEFEVGNVSPNLPNLPTGVNASHTIPGTHITHYNALKAYEAAKTLGPQNKISAIKDVRTLTGSSLRGAKYFVEEAMNGASYNSCFHHLAT